ncbi:hypothetical protein Pint_30517 [Pistacia integerrima]|uniref:Uncharacterized protein n=1 Tax=Pistacia integerrima TaxID=434235 RepID=A0ACC0X2A3_9ROSI|nr:hypothetical protein Pint_30517 [Pistacia integerrima]
MGYDCSCPAKAAAGLFHGCCILAACTDYSVTCWFGLTLYLASYSLFLGHVQGC